ncbi:MAG: OmpA family protein [Deltaproteobacteria bacterium]|jgi:OOP family OmpA-OmpF porin|nr:OmpA family protein [Deltaproteobacteria bacterium]
MVRKMSLMVMLGSFLFTLSVAQTMALEEVVTTETVAKVYTVEKYEQIADNVVILFDTSTSMNDPYRDTGMTKLQAAKKLLEQRAAAFPDAFPSLKVGLYSYTPGGLNFKGYDVFYKMQAFDRVAFLEAVSKLPDEGKGPTLIQNALSRLDELLAKLSGHTVVFLFTDGSYTEMMAGDDAPTDSGIDKDDSANKPVNMAKALAQKYDVNFQVISTTDVATNLEIMKRVASVNASSRVIPIELLLDRPEVYTGAVFAIEEDYIIDAETREKVVGFKLDHILFGFDKADIEMEFTDELDAVGKILKDNPDSYIVLAGFTDSQGPEEYNLGLSRQRVEAVGAYLAEQFQIDADRIALFWYGEAAPVASNDTEEGRQQNRRVLGFVAGLN